MRRPDEELAANLLAVQPWIQVLLLWLTVMAMARLRRASLYIKKHFVPLANSLPGEDIVLQFEIVSTDLLTKGAPGPNFLTNKLAASWPVLLINWLPAPAFAFTAIVVHPDDLRGPLVIAGVIAASLATGIAFYGGWASLSHETER